MFDLITKYVRLFFVVDLLNKCGTAQITTIEENNYGWGNWHKKINN